MYDLTGQKVLADIQHTNATEIALNISDLKAGIYFVVMDTKDGKATKRLVVN